VKRRITWIALLIVTVGVLGWGGYQTMSETLAPAPGASSAVPVTMVQRGDVRYSVMAKGRLQGGNSETHIAPMVGANELVITELRSPGELVREGDVIVQFDTTEQEFELLEAQADLAEAQQQIRKAKAASEVRRQETQLALLEAEAAVETARIECRKNSLVAAIVARQNELALQAAEDQLRQLREDLANQSSTSEASIAIQEAAARKATVRAETARGNIEAMTLRTKRSGYVALEQNTYSGNMFFFGMQLPIFQVGDAIRAGLLIAQIPDLQSWEITATIGELDRGHLEVGHKVKVHVIAAPERPLGGYIKNIGGTTGPAWERIFECRIALNEVTPALRQGMSVELEILTGEEKDVLWIPSQALFESDGRTFVYGRDGNSFHPVDVKLTRRSESQAVITGVEEHTEVALASPDEIHEENRKEGSVMNALPGR
jgi:HlyD family secretion protein